MSILESLLPMAAGLALSATGIGALPAAMMVGAGYGMANDSLEQGLLAGLGAYGGAGLGAGLAGSGTAAAAAAPSAAAPMAETAASAAMPAADAAAAFGDTAASTAGAAAPWEAGFEGTGALAGSANTAASTAGLADTAAAGAAPWEAGFEGTGALAGAAPQAASAAAAPSWEAGFQGSNALAGGAGGAGATPWESGFEGTNALADSAAAPAAQAAAPGGFQQMGNGLAGLNTPAGSNAFMASQGGGMGLMQNGMMAMAPSMDPNFGHKIKPFDPSAGADQGTIRAYNYNPSNQTYSARAPVSYKDFKGFADGGGISGLMQGPGDGVSDSIPATVNGNQPAALADGEFVVPARIVSELGNGSTDAGARKLYAMLERVQRQRKTTQVAARGNAERMLPA